MKLRHPKQNVPVFWATLFVVARKHKKPTQFSICVALVTEKRQVDGNQKLK